MIAPSLDLESTPQLPSGIPSLLSPHPDEISECTESEPSQPSLLPISDRGRAISTTDKIIAASTGANKALAAKKAASAPRKVRRASPRLHSAAEATRGSAPMEATTTDKAIQPILQNPSAVRIKTDRLAHPLELYAHTNPINPPSPNLAPSRFLYSSFDLAIYKAAVVRAEASLLTKNQETDTGSPLK
jgi:hypothetical protein